MKNQLKRLLREHFEFEVTLLYSPHTVVVAAPAKERARIVTQKINAASKDILSLFDRTTK